MHKRPCSQIVQCASESSDYAALYKLFYFLTYLLVYIRVVVLLMFNVLCHEIISMKLLMSYSMIPILCLSSRALFDYDPTSDAGLPGRGLEFKYGHVLNVVGDDDSDWWHAVRVMPDDGASGVIPSKHR